jgi:hypothetical protein
MVSKRTHFYPFIFSINQMQIYATVEKNEQ